MFKQVVFFVFLTGAVVFARPSQKNISETVSVLAEDVAALRNELSNLSANVRSIQKEIDILNMKSNTMSDEMRTAIEKIAGNCCKDCAREATVTQQINNLSTAFSDEINKLSVNFQGVLNRIIVTLNAQQKLSDVTENTTTKNPDGIAYSVKAGETLDGIATKFGTTRETIKSMNFIIDENRLPVGQMLFIPQAR